MRAARGNTHLGMRRASSNYLDLGEDDLFFHAPGQQQVQPPPSIISEGSMEDRSRVTAGMPGLPQRESFRGARALPRVPGAGPQMGVFEVLHAKFGFQAASVANQKENFACWMANYQLRPAEQGGGDPYAALSRVHAKFFKNYFKWCKFLGTKPQAAADGANANLLEREVALLLCIWGEAANLRFMPECICFLYHSMAGKMEGMEDMADIQEGFFLQSIVRPVYHVVAKMRTATSSDPNKPLDHKDTINYDDINEFFWTPMCLSYDELNVAEVLKIQSKSFKEKRSVCGPLLGFFRIWYSLLVMFHILSVIAYVDYYTEGKGWFTSSRSDLRNHAMLSVLISVAGFLMVKVGLQIWLYGLRTFKDPWLVMGVFGRLVWHSVFFAIGILINVSPNEKAIVKFGSGAKTGTYLSMGSAYVLIYLAPVLLAAFIRMFFIKGIWSIRLLNSLDGTRRQYIGREMSQPWGPFLQYALSWTIIFTLKFLFALELMIKPLIGPSIEIYNTAVASSNGVFASGHNLLFVGALWVPVLVVYLYDAQIWFILFQSIVGLVMGFRMKMGHCVGVEQTKAALYQAPEQFDKTVASIHARAQLVSQQGEPGAIRTASVRLRFAIIWNEIISSFRSNDLLDDRETVILQYRVLQHGVKIQNPIFLLAGKITKAIQLAVRARPNSWTTAELTSRLEKMGLIDGVHEGMELIRDIFHLLLGNEEGEGEGALTVLEYLFNAKDPVSIMDLAYLPALAENVVELLSAILDMPDDLAAMDGIDEQAQHVRVEFHDQVRKVVDRMGSIFQTLELMLNDGSVKQRLNNCSFMHLTTDLQFQKDQLLALYKAEAFAQSGMPTSARPFNGDEPVGATKYAREDFISSCTRLFFLLRLDIAHAQPRCEDARRRINFFLHSLSMDIPTVASVEAMPSFSVMTPYYSETVLFTLDELQNPVHSNPLFAKLDQRAKQKGRSDLNIMGYLITFHAEEWSNFLERMGVTSTEEALEEFPMQVRLWASLRGQTLARTVYGMMMYEDALRLLRWLELWNEMGMDEGAKVDEMNRISALKFSYITGCQIYSQQVQKGDPRAADIDYLMKRFPSWRVSFVDQITERQGDADVTRYDCVLVKAEGDEIVEVYRYELPGNPILGEGKPENQNVALPFTRGEYLQTIDMNQEHYFEEALKMPNFLATATSSREEVTIIGMKEHVFTGRASSLARFMTLQELVFVTLTQRVLANPLRARMHYGHPDVFEKSFVMTNGGVSKASKGINLSEDVFSGYNVTLRGGLVTHIEFMQCGKGRDVTLSQINAFEAKLSNGCAESCLSREGHRMSSHLDFFRLNSMFYGHFGFYICNALTVMCVYIYAYSKLYISTHSNVVSAVATNTDGLNNLATVVSTQYLLQFGLLTTLPLMATLLVEFGWKQAVLQVFELISCMGVVFYVFLTGTKAHYYDVALIRGGSKYRGTGRGFSITRDPMVNFFKEYGVSHFRKAVELIGIMILYGMFDTIDMKGYSASQSYGIASFAVLFLGACWLLGPFLFNTDGLVLEKTRIDLKNWLAWMMRVKMADERIDDPEQNNNIGTPSDSWREFWDADVELMANLGPMGRLTYALRELRHPLFMYFVFITEFGNRQVPLLLLAVFATWGAIWGAGLVTRQSIGHNQKLMALTVRGFLYMVIVLGGIGLGPVVLGWIFGWDTRKGFALSSSIFLGLNAICQYAVAFHGVFGLKLATSGPIVTLGFIYDMLVGMFLVIPLAVLSFLPFMRILQTRMMYNGGFSRALSSGSEVAASICIMLGLMGGYIFGGMSSFVMSLGYVNRPSMEFANRSFLFFIKDMLAHDSVNMNAWVKNGSLKGLSTLAAVVAVLISLGLSKILGRRLNMALGCALIGIASVLNYVNIGGIIILCTAMIQIGCALLAINYLLYCFEICTKGWRGKSVMIFMLGTMLGYISCGAYLDKTNKAILSGDLATPRDNWRKFPLYGVLPFVVLFIVVSQFVPESPTWHLTRGDVAKCKATLIRLRRRQNVKDEMNAIDNELKEPRGKRNLFFRVCFSFALQMLLAILLSGSLMLPVLVKADAKSKGQKSSTWIIRMGICCTAGLVFGVFLIDQVRRKTILKDFLPFMSIVAVISALLKAASDKQDNVLEVFLPMVYVAAGVGLMGVTWLSSLEIFAASNRAICFSLSFGMFYCVEAVLYRFTPSFPLCLGIFGAGGGLLTMLIFAICASTKKGAVQLKREKQRQKEEALRARQGDGPAGYAASATDFRSSNGSFDSTMRAPVAATVPQHAMRREVQPSARLNYMAPPPPAQIPYLSLESQNELELTNGESLLDLDSLRLTTNENDPRGPPIQLSMLRPPPASAESFNFSIHEEDFDDDDNEPQQPGNLSYLMRQISMRQHQSRSESFLESTAFPDAQVQAETRWRGVRL